MLYKTLILKENKEQYKKPTLPIDISYATGSNIKISTEKKGKANTTTYFNTCGTYSDTNYGSYGYDVGPTSADFYNAGYSEHTTVKETFGIDDDYFYYGYDLEFYDGKNESFSTYGRINVRKEIVYVGAAVVSVAFVAPVIAEVNITSLVGVSEQMLYKTLEIFSTMVPIFQH